MNTFVVETAYSCDEMTVDMENYQPSPVWRTTALGCKVLLLLQDMYNFEMIYVSGSHLWDPRTADSNYTSVDIYARPQPLKTDTFEYACPMQAIIARRYGFILRRPDVKDIRAFFSLPFTLETWYWLFIIIAIISLVLYMLCLWEKRVLNPWCQEYSFVYELLVMLGACCQHIPPVNPLLTSRRIGYFTFFCFSYMVYSFYTSNLLSHLVNDKDKTMTISQLVSSDYEFIVLDSIQMHAWRSVHTPSTAPLLNPKDLKLLKKKVANLKYLNISESLKAITNTRTALLSDYVTVYPYMGALDNEVICDLAEVDLFKDIKEYIFTSKTFLMKDQFRVGMLRIKETGVLKRIKRDNVYSAPRCAYNPEPSAGLNHVVTPLIILGGCMLLAVAVMLLENLVFHSTRVWPYVD